MTDYYVHHTGSNTSPYNSWATAATTLSTLYTYKSSSYTGSDRVFIGHDHVDASTGISSFGFSTSDFRSQPTFISATTGSSPPTYQAGTTVQFYSTASSYMGFLGCYVKGLTLRHNAATGYFNFNNSRLEDCKIILASGRYIYNVSARYYNCIISDEYTVSNNTGYLLQDSTDSLSAGIYENVTFTNCGYRTGPLANSLLSCGRFVGCDLSSLTAVASVVTSGTNCGVVFDSCKLPSGLIMSDTATTTMASANGIGSESFALYVGCTSTSYDGLMFRHHRGSGVYYLKSSVYRDGGFRTENTSASWYFSHANSYNGTYKSSPFSTIALPRYLEAGTYTVTLYMTNDTRNLKDDEVWVEGSAITSSGTFRQHITTRNAHPLNTASTYPSDTSTWNGSPSFTYKQKITFSVTISVASVIHLAIKHGLTTIPSNFYIDPAISYLES